MQSADLFKHTRKEADCSSRVDTRKHVRYAKCLWAYTLGVQIVARTNARIVSKFVRVDRSNPAPLKNFEGHVPDAPVPRVHGTSMDNAIVC